MLRCGWGLGVPWGGGGSVPFLRDGGLGRLQHFPEADGTGFTCGGGGGGLVSAPRGGARPPEPQHLIAASSQARKQSIRKCHSLALCNSLEV